MSFPSLVHFLSRPVYRHLNVLFNELDAVEDQTGRWARKVRAEASRPGGLSLRRTFLYLTVLHLLSNSLGYFGLEYEATGGFTLAGALSHPYIFSRQFLPGRLGLEGDIVAFTTAVCATGILLAFSFTRPLSAKHRFTYNGDSLQVNGKTIDPQVAGQILQFRRAIRRNAAKGCIAYFSGAYACFYVSVYLNNVYRCSVFSFIYWFCIFPTYPLTCVLALWGLPVFLITTTRYIELYQQSIIGKIAQLRAGLLPGQSVGKGAPPPRTLLAHSWTAFYHLNMQITSLGKDILEYSRFWWPFLSLIFPSYIADLSYLFYIVALNHTVPLLHKTFFFLPIPYFLSLLYFIIYRCARIGKMNGRILRENGRYRMALIQKFGFLPLSVLLKGELLLNSNRLHPYTFHYLANIRITPRTFEVIISSMTIFCLLVFKNPYLAI